MGTVIPEATFLAGLGASPYAAEAALPAFFGEGLLGFGASQAAESAIPGTIESMGGLSYLDGVPQNFGARLASIGNNFMPGEHDWLKNAKYLSMFDEEPPQSSAGQPTQTVNQAPARQQYQTPGESFLEIIRKNNMKHFANR